MHFHCFATYLMCFRWKIPSCVLCQYWFTYIMKMLFYVIGTYELNRFIFFFFCLRWACRGWRKSHSGRVCSFHRKCKLKCVWIIFHRNRFVLLCHNRKVYTVNTFSNTYRFFFCRWNKAKTKNWSTNAIK